MNDKFFMLSPEMKKLSQNIAVKNDATLKNMFNGKIRGTFLIKVKYEVMNRIAPFLFNIYDFQFSEESMLSAGDNAVEYEICKHIVGVHHANTVFMSENEISTHQKEDAYINKLANQVSENVALRLFGSAYFRNKDLVIGERYLFYPVPYELFVMCMQMERIFAEQKFKN